jgi:hypothetical protein
VSEEYTESRDKVEYLTLAQIHSIRLQAMKRYGYGLGLLGMGWMTVYADTEPGKDFFKNFNAIFSGRI